MAVDRRQQLELAAALRRIVNEARGPDLIRPGRLLHGGPGCGHHLLPLPSSYLQALLAVNPLDPYVVVLPARSTQIAGEHWHAPALAPASKLPNGLPATVCPAASTLCSTDCFGGAHQPTTLPTGAPVYLGHLADGVPPGRRRHHV